MGKVKVAVTGTVSLEVTCYVEVNEINQAVEKAYEEYPLLDQRLLLELNRKLKNGLMIYPYHVEPIAWLKPEIVNQSGEQTRFDL